jgi:hypothetical protein
MEGTIWSPPPPAETRYQRIGREQRERQAARAQRMKREAQVYRLAARVVRKVERERQKEKAYLEWLIDDHNHEMDG